MRTLGIDLSSQNDNTATCLITWAAAKAIVSAPSLGVSDAAIVSAIAESDITGIDVPFGWPAAFVTGVTGYASGKWNTDATPAALRLRATDRYIQETTGLCPLSVSADRIAMPAMRAARLFARSPWIDVIAARMGLSRIVIEVYPAAALRRWAILSTGYKKRDTSGTDARRRILAALKERLAGTLEFTCPEALFEDYDHPLDALLSALVARCHLLSLTDKPPETVRGTLPLEGWIALPHADALSALSAPSPCR